MTARRVGILGGMGPQATVLLMSRLIAATPARDDADHIPLIVDQNPQVPSRIRYIIEGQGEDPGPTLAAMARRLEGAGAVALAMPCNTAHYFAPAIRAAVTIPLIDMVALSVAHAAKLAGSGGTVGILASPAVRQIGLFDQALAANGMSALYPQDQDAMLATIRMIKAQGAGPASKAALATASTELLLRGARVQMIACTEFSLIADSIPANAVVFDTLDRLVAGIMDFATSPEKATEKAERQPPRPSAHAPDFHPNKETIK